MSSPATFVATRHYAGRIAALPNFVATSKSWSQSSWHTHTHTHNGDPHLRKKLETNLHLVPFVPPQKREFCTSCCLEKAQTACLRTKSRTWSWNRTFHWFLIVFDFIFMVYSLDTVLQSGVSFSGLSRANWRWENFLALAKHTFARKRMSSLQDSTNSAVLNVFRVQQEKSWSSTNTCGRLSTYTRGHCLIWLPQNEVDEHVQASETAFQRGIRFLCVLCLTLFSDRRGHVDWEHNSTSLSHTQRPVGH